MNPTDHTAKTPSATTGRFAVSFSSLRGGGSGATREGVVEGRKPSLHLLVSLALATAGLLALTASPALAARGHEQSGTIGEPCTEEPCAPGKLKDPAGVAVNEATGHLYVLDKGNDRVEIFSSAGAYLGFFDGSGTSEFEGTPDTGPAAGSLGREENGEPVELETGRFEEPEGIAVDNSCTLHTPPLTELTSPTCAEFDPSYGDVYVADGPREENENSHAVVDKFSPSGEYLGQIIRNPGGEFPASGFRRLYGVAVDRGGEVWVEEENFGELFHAGAASYTNEAVNKWIAFHGSESVGLSAQTAPGFTVDSTHNLYVHNLSGKAGDAIAKFSSSGELLVAPFGELGPTAVATELTTDDVYVANEATIHRYTSAEHQLETLPVPGAHADALAVDSASQTLYAADSSTDLLYVYAPNQPGPPTVEPESTGVAEVTSDAAVLSGEINPRSDLGDPPTDWRFEYGPCATPSSCATSPFEAAIPVPDGSLTANYEADPVAASLAGLAPATTYHLRLSAENSRSTEPTLGEELIFTTQPASAAAVLPDHRAYELVSPPKKQGALIEPITFSGVIESSLSGDAITYFANSPTEAGAAGFSQDVQILSRRAGAPSAPWLSADIATPHSAAAGTAIGIGGGEYRIFSPDLSRAVVQPFGPFTALSPDATERTAYLRTDFPPGEPANPCLASCYQALVTEANVPPGTHFGEEEDQELARGPVVLAASPDLSHLVLRSEAPLTGTPGDPGGLYEWAAGDLHLLSVRPDGTPVPSLATRLALGYSDENGKSPNRRHAVSADGSRVVFFEAASASAGHLYLRADATAPQSASGACDEAARACTIQLDALQGGSGAGKVEPIFQDASADGSRIFFTDPQQLVPGASQSGADLYECEVEEAAGVTSCNLHDLTAQGSGEGAGVLGFLPGASEDGGSVYFVANGRLTDGAKTRGEEAVAGNCLANATNATPEAETASQHCNLYVRTGGQIRLVAVLSGADFPDWAIRGKGGLVVLTARVSPSGRYLAFMSQRSLTGYDNRDAVSEARDQEVFLYDAAADGGQGRLICASCDPTGARPHGVEYGRINAEVRGRAGGPNVWPDNAWIAANVPGWTPTSADFGEALYQSRYLSDQGRLFFNAADSLVPGDTNGTEDVYQWEPPQGEGTPPNDTCTTSSPTYSPASGGCVDLISSGASSEESAFMDASESGNDVFFLTSARLSKRDEDTAADLYDARAGGGEDEAIKPVECSGDACQQPAVPPNDQTPGSLTFNGAGNVLQCPKGKVLKKGKCVKKKAKKHKKHHKKSHKRANSDRGGHK